jgi:hypothetical protein
MNNKMHFKINCNNEIRRFNMDKSDLTFTKFVQQVKELFGLKETPTKIQYKDVDGDLVTCASNIEFECAISQTPKDGVLHVRIEQPRFTWKRHSRSWCDEASVKKSGENVQKQSSEEEKESSSEEKTEESVEKFGRFCGRRRRHFFWMNLAKDEREKLREKWRKLKERKEKWLKKKEKWEKKLAWRLQKKRERKLCEGVHKHCKRAKLELTDDFPKTTSLYLDGNNMFIFKRLFRSIAKQGEDTDALLAEMISNLHKKLKFKETVLLFEKTKLDCGLTKDGIEIKCAQPDYETSHDALYDIAKKSKNVKQCLFVTSDRELLMKLRKEGVKAIRPRRLIKFAMRISGDDVDNVTEWMQKLKV